MSKEVIYPTMVIRSQEEAIELLEKENTQLKKSLENAQEIYKNSHKYTSECEDKVIVFQTQQKEFLNYLRELSNWYSADGVKQGMVNDILTKYKEITDKGIGEDKK